MSATTIQHPAGTARPCLSGGYTVDLSDPIPTWVPSRDAALDLLNSRTTTKTTAMRRDRGRQVGAALGSRRPHHP